MEIRKLSSVVPGNGNFILYGPSGSGKTFSLSTVKGKLLILHGSADTAITMDQFAKLASELEQNGVSHEMITYSGAPHAFTVFGSSRYREDADKKSWKRFTEYLSETLK